MDPAKVAQMVEVFNRLIARDALSLMVSCILTILDEAPSDWERQQSLDGCIDWISKVVAASASSLNVIAPYSVFDSGSATVCTRSVASTLSRSRSGP